MTIVYGMGHHIDMSIIGPVITGAVFVVIGNFLPRFKHNYTFGLKTPWSLANEQVWRRSNLVAGRFFFFGGLFMMLCALLPGMWKFVGTLTILLISVLVPVVITFIDYRKHSTN